MNSNTVYYDASFSGEASTSDNDLTTGIANAWHPHRAPWYSAPPSQINWWIPIYDVRTQYLKSDPRPLPRPTQSRELDPQIRLICPAEGIILYAGAQMHSSVPNTSGKTIFNIDFMVVNVTDVSAKRGVPGVDKECTARH